eukprot:GABV01000009.1.p1 GENE.GABV01000009.1~~GABV01000009.1.p1  ORF type:complete len:631 (+),score=266.77 GABV01000009.1:187-2079(+)
MVKTVGQSAIEGVRALKRDKSNWKKALLAFCEAVSLEHVEKSTHRDALEAVFAIMNDLLNQSEPDVDGFVLCLESLQRLFRSKGLYRSIPKVGADPLVNALAVQDDKLNIVTLQTIAALITFLGHTAQEKHPWERASRQHFEDIKGWNAIIAVLKRVGPQALAFPDAKSAVVVELLRILSTTLVVEAISTPVDVIQRLLGLLKPQWTLLLQLVESGRTEVTHQAMLVVCGVLLHSPPAERQAFQQKALIRGTTLQVFYRALFNRPFGVADDVKEFDEAKGADVQQHCQLLVGLLTDGFAQAHDVFVRCLPSRFFQRFDSGTPGGDLWFDMAPIVSQAKGHEKSFANESTWHQYETGKLHKTAWQAIFQHAANDFEDPDLVWNETTRAELQNALEVEIIDFNDILARAAAEANEAPAAPADSKSGEKSIAAPTNDDLEEDKRPAWDFAGFEVQYPSLDNELQVFGYFLRLLIRELENESSTFTIPKEKLNEFVLHLYRRAVVEDDHLWKLGTLRCSYALFAKYRDVLTECEPIAYYSWLLSPDHVSSVWRDLLFKFFDLLFDQEANVRTFIEAKGLDHLDFSLLASTRRKHPKKSRSANPGGNNCWKSLKCEMKAHFLKFHPQNRVSLNVR